MGNASLEHRPQVFIVEVLEGVVGEDEAQLFGRKCDTLQLGARIEVMLRTMRIFEKLGIMNHSCYRFRHFHLGLDQELLVAVMQADVLPEMLGVVWDASSNSTADVVDEWIALEVPVGVSEGPRSLHVLDGLVDILRKPLSLSPREALVVIHPDAELQFQIRVPVAILSVLVPIRRLEVIVDSVRSCHQKFRVLLFKLLGPIIEVAVLNQFFVVILAPLDHVGLLGLIILAQNVVHLLHKLPPQSSIVVFQAP